MRTQVKIEAVTTAQLRDITRVCHAQAEQARNPLRANTVPGWAPTVHCEGPDLWTVYLPPCTVPGALAVLSAINPTTTTGAEKK